MSWLYLLLAGLFEIGWPVGLKISQMPETRWVGIASTACAGFESSEGNQGSMILLILASSLRDLRCLGAFFSGDWFRR
ncbi:MAG: hypothetical protein ACO3S8_04850 [Aquiluna sp.]